VGKILVIDDSLVMRNIHKNALKDHGFGEDTIVECDNGMIALDLLMKNEVELIVVDWNMPMLDGLQFVQTVRSDPKYKELPIIMVTSEAAKTNVMEAIKAGVTNYVVKPITGDKLWAKFQPYLKPL
jgi:two-component system, chemotaxis family, chemotaxis protein CheY